MWTVCPSTMSNNSFHARLNQGSSDSQRPTKNICCQLPAGLENVLDIFCNGAKAKVFAQSAGPTMNMFRRFPLPLTKRSRKASANTIGCKSLIQ